MRRLQRRAQHRPRCAWALCVGASLLLLTRSRALAAPDDAAFRELEATCAALSVAGDEAAAEHARGALWALQKAMDDRASALARLERERRFNADELCYVSKEKSLVGRRVCRKRRNPRRLRAQG